MKYLADKHESYIQDTPDFIRKVEELNKKICLPQNALIVTLDVMALFTNIPQTEGTQSTETALNKRIDQNIPTEYIVSMLKIILKNNIFEFNGELYSQEEGTSMGPKHSPHYADVFMADVIDPKIKYISEKYEEHGIDFMKRFLDDILKIFVGTTKKLHMFFDEINKMHPSIKFTMSHTTNSLEDISTKCACPIKDIIAFLDTSLQIVDGKIILDLYKKETDRNMYLLSSSCHPPHQHDNIPCSLAMRIKRICTYPETRDTRFGELKQYLLDQDYNPKMVDSAIAKTNNITREEALKKVVKQTTTKRPVMVVSWDPRLPPLDAIQ